jgi:hypothetical protein
MRGLTVPTDGTLAMPNIQVTKVYGWPWRPISTINSIRTPLRVQQAARSRGQHTNLRHPVSIKAD